MNSDVLNTQETRASTQYYNDSVVLKFTVMTVVWGIVGMSVGLYIVQRTCHAPLFGKWLAEFAFWGWQAVIVAAAISLPMGLTQGKEYAELIWPSCSSAPSSNATSNIFTCDRARA